MIYRYSGDLPDAFFAAGPAICGRLGANWEDLLRVMWNESACYGNACNKDTGASGLIQFVGSTLAGLGWHDGAERFRHLNALDQLPWVERFFSPHAGKLDSLQAVYLAVFMPAHLDHRGDPAFVLAKVGGETARVNPSLRGPDGSITVGGLAVAARRACHGPRWEEIAWRAGLLMGPPRAA